MHPVTVFGLCLLSLSWSGCVRAQTQGDYNLIVSILDYNQLPTVFAGENHTLHCSSAVVSNGYVVAPDTALVWVRDNMKLDTKPISTADFMETISVNFDLFLHPVELSDAGQYKCRVEEGNSSVQESFPLNLAVLDPSDIQAPPEQYALVDSDVALTCSTTITFGDITWFNQIDDPIDGMLESVTVHDEGLYRCNVYLGTYNIDRDRDVRLFVIVPPSIASNQPPNDVIHGNIPFTLSVTFQSRLTDTTNVSWFKDGEPVSTSDIFVQFPSNGMDGTTRVTFDPVRRSDSGVYRVEVVNNFNLIPEDERRVERSFQITVKVAPAVVANVQTENISPLSTRVTWSLTNQNADDAALYLTVFLWNFDQSEAQQYVIPGNQTQYTLDVVPGTEYLVSVATHNQDGTQNSSVVPFQAASTGPAISSLVIVRSNGTTFVLSVTLNYTGGKSITHFTISFRVNGSTPWTGLEAIPAIPSTESDLTWNGVISSGEFEGVGLMEFQVGVNNQLAGVSTLETIETLVLPGAPTSITLTSSSTTSLGVEVQLSEKGSFPILELVLTIISPTRLIYSSTGWYQPGETVNVALSGLHENTAYTLTAYEVNYGGRGPESDQVIIFTTEAEDNSQPVWVVPVIVVPAIIVLLILILAALLVVVRCHRVRAGKRIHHVTNPAALPAESKKLDPNNEMITRPRKPSFPPIGGVTFTPREPTSASCSDPFSPAGCTHFPFNTRSTGTGSNHDSDESESSYPRQVYHVSPSPGQSFPSILTQLTIPTSVTSIHSSSHSESLRGSSVNSASRQSITTCPPAPVSNSTFV